MDQFLLFGDSLTQQSFSQTLGPNSNESAYFGPSLVDAYIRKFDIINRGLNGYNTTLALHVLPQIMPSPAKARVRIMTIFFGANDARLPNTPGGPQQHVPLEVYGRNLRAMATHECVRAHEGIKVVLITPPPIDERMFRQRVQAELPELGPETHRRTAETTAKYAAAVVRVGKELGLPVVNLWRAMLTRANAPPSEVGELLTGAMDAPTNEMLQSFFVDGLHLSREGYVVLYEELMKVIEQEVPDLMPEKLELVLPSWRDEEAWKDVYSVTDSDHTNSVL